MKSFEDFTGLAVPYMNANIDTDEIIPKQFLTSIRKTGYGLFLFNDERWLTPAANSEVTADQLEANPDFVLNQGRYQGASILLAGNNFGCGSSREHAVWALQGHGFKAVIAPSFADIFSTNSSKNGLLLIALPEKEVASLAQVCEESEGFTIKVVLSDDKPYVEAAGKRHHFEIDPGIKERLIAGIDEIGITEQLREKIKDYEKKRKASEPWLDLGTAE